MGTATDESWETVIGLEVHCELATATKLFCSCPNVFGGDPNTNVCPTCLGLPGSLPVVNGRAVEFAMRLGRALNCDVQASVFDRKNYFYPDMPKDFQTTQLSDPTSIDGHVDLPDGTVCRIDRAHIEEDTGKSTHVGGDGRIHDAEYSLVDYNRAGVPLVEIVGQPDLRSAEAARSYVSELRDILLATGVSDAKMEEGSMRVDANVSVRPIGSDELRTRCEIKNVNSLRSLVRAIEYEAARHVDLYDNNDKPRQETRHWDEGGGRTLPGRSKEDSDDYRYFSEPDLPPFVPTDADIAAIDADLPRMPAQRRNDLVIAAASGSDKIVGNAALAVERNLDSLAMDAIAAGADADRVLTHVANNLAVEGAESVRPEAFADLVKMESAGDLTATQAKQVLVEMVETGKGPAEIAAARGFEALDSNELDGTLDQIIADNADAWAELVASEDKKDIKKKMGFFTGEVMKATKGQADGRAVNEALSARRKA